MHRMIRTLRWLVGLLLSVGGLMVGSVGAHALDDDPEPDPPTVWTVGDSITAGVGTGNRSVDSYPAQLRSLGYVVQSVGTPGQCLVVVGCLSKSAMTETVESVLGDAQPGDVLVLEAGTNDLGRATDAQLKRGYRAVVREGAARGVDVIVGTIPPRGEAKAWLVALTERQRVRINYWLRTRGWALADFDTRLERRTDHALAPRFDSGDGLHPNVKGATAMARLVAKSLDWL
jgi:lysophospholipase L1-like esterase